MSRLIPVPAIAAGTWASGVADAAALPASGNALYDCRVALAEETIYIWTGSAWVGIAGGGGGGVTTVGAFSGSAQTNGAAISGTTITFGPASATVPGMVSTGAQVWAGAKTFNAAPIMAALTASLPVVTDGSKGLASVSYATFLASLGAAPTASPTFTGTVTLPSGSVTSSAWNTGTSTFTSNGVAFTAKAPLASPTFTGTVTIPTGASITAPVVATSARFSYATASTVPYWDSNKDLISSAVTPTELGLLAGKTAVGDVSGPGVTVDNTIPRFDSTTGKIIQTSAATMADTTGSIRFPADGGVEFNSASIGIWNLSSFEAGTMLFRVASTGRSFTYQINGVTKAQLNNDDLQVYTSVYNVGSGRFGYTTTSSLPAPFAHSYFKDIHVDTGANTTIGTATLVGGTVTVSTNKVLTGDTIFLSRNTPGGTTGDLSAPVASIVNATSFVINSTSALDTSTVNWWIIHTF